MNIVPLVEFSTTRSRIKYQNSCHGKRNNIKQKQMLLTLLAISNLFANLINNINYKKCYYILKYKIECLFSL
jgi:hypothetical protein